MTIPRPAPYSHRSHRVFHALYSIRDTLDPAGNYNGHSLALMLPVGFEPPVDVKEINAVLGAVGVQCDGRYRRVGQDIIDRMEAAIQNGTRLSGVSLERVTR